jgi:hypothetical protein
MTANVGTEFLPPDWDTENVLYGVGYLFTAQFGTPLPADSDLGDATKWAAVVTPGPWRYAGATSQGVTTTFNPSMTDLQVEEQPIPVAALVNTATYQITTSLSEETIDNINLAYGGGGAKTVTAAGAAQPGKTVLKLSSNFSVLAAAILGSNEQGYPRVFYIPKIQSAGQVQTAFRRAASQRLYPITLNALCDLSEMEIIDITAAATS